MTEEEASEKWRPFSRVGSYSIAQRQVVASFNRDGYAAAPVDGSGCIGSACMAWRIDRFSSEPDDKGGTKLVASGHCGLAGNL